MGGTAELKTLVVIDMQNDFIDGVLGTKEAKEVVPKVVQKIDTFVKEAEEDDEERCVIENPRGGLRKMPWMQGLPRYTVTYCQYGDSRMKPTDIWTNHPKPMFKPPCKNGDPCHVRAPRGAWWAGTQGLKDNTERSIIPAALCEHIVDICEEEGESTW